MNERTAAIGRAQRALQALAEHPRSCKQELGQAREHLNACYAAGDGSRVWDSVIKAETMAARRYGVPSVAELRGARGAAGAVADLDAGPTQAQGPTFSRYGNVDRDAAKTDPGERAHGD
ncbi:hypothetical protein [Nocardioides sp. InS609-2]|uniref:hypothetical protein n=1 Tax=Nocardioides sp. InS609-2 TaxID=2760705 RepID=UPI0020BE7FBE|nr:hypothetical protein [Nocardioides sp. InS609-2]